MPKTEDGEIQQQISPSAGKQPCIRYVKLPPNITTASTHTNRCPTGNQLSSAPATEHRSAGKQPCIRYVKLPSYNTASTYTNRCPPGNQLSSAPASSSLFTQVEQLKAVGIPKTSKYSDTHTHTPMGIYSLRTCVSLCAHYGPMYPSMLTTDPYVPYMLILGLYISQCSLRTCVSLYAHYGPVYPSMLTTDQYTRLYAYSGPVYPSMLTTDLYTTLFSLRSPLYT